MGRIRLLLPLALALLLGAATDSTDPPFCLVVLEDPSRGQPAKVSIWSHLEGTMELGALKIDRPQEFFAGLDDISRPVVPPTLLRSLKPVQRISTLVKRGRQEISLNLHEDGAYLVHGQMAEKEAFVVVVVSDLRLTVKVGQDKMLAFAQEAWTGKPIPEAKVEVIRQGKVVAGGTTDQDGCATIGLQSLGPFLVLAQAGDSITLASGAYYPAQACSYAAYLVTDRQVYQIGDEVLFKGVIRACSPGGYALTGPLRLSTELLSPRGTVVARDEIASSPLGSIDGAVPLKVSEGGPYRFRISFQAETFEVGFWVQEVEGPPFDVILLPDRFATVAGPQVLLTLKAHQPDGSPLPEGKVRWAVHRSPRHRLAWLDEALGHLQAMVTPVSGRKVLVEQGQGSLDAKGAFTFRINTAKEKEPVAMVIEASVQDRSRRVVTKQVNVGVAPTERQVDLRTDKRVYGLAEPVLIEARLVDPAGEPVQGTVELAVHPGGGTRDTSPIWTKTLNVGPDGKAKVAFGDAPKGNLLIKARALGGVEHTCEAETDIWVAMGDDIFLQNNRNLVVVPDRHLYRAGDMARVLLIMPSGASHALVTREGATLEERRLIQARGSMLVDLPIEAPFGSGLHLGVATVYGGSLYSQTVPVHVEPSRRLLNVKVEQDRDVYCPGCQADLRVMVTDYLDRPVKAEVLVAVVDQAATSDMLPRPLSPLAFFHSANRNNVLTVSSVGQRSYGSASSQLAGLGLLPGGLITGMLGCSDGPSPQDHPDASMMDRPFVVQAVKEGAGERTALPEEAISPIPHIPLPPEGKVTALWAPSLITDAKGQAKVRVTLPDRTTTWNATFLAFTEDTQVGEARSRLTIVPPFALSLGLPPFLVAGDHSQGLLEIKNHTGALAPLSVELKSSGVTATGGGSRRLDADEAARITVKLEAQGADRGEITALVRSGNHLSKQSHELIILPGWLQEEKGVSAVVDGGGALELDLPLNDRFRGMEVMVTEGVAALVHQALQALLALPEGSCVEDISRILALVEASAVVAGQEEGELAKLLQRASKDIATRFRRIYGMQHREGGFGWLGSGKADPFITAFVAEGLVRAQGLGAEVDKEVLELTKGALRRFLAPEPADPARAAVALALASLGDEEGDGLIAKLLAEAPSLSPASLARALLAAELRGKSPEDLAGPRDILASKVVRGGQGEAWWEDNEGRVMATALALRALAPSEPDLVQPALRSLASQRKGKAWGSIASSGEAIRALAPHLLPPPSKGPAPRLKVNGTALALEGKEQCYRAWLRPKDLKDGQATLSLQASADGPLTALSALVHLKQAKKLNHGLSLTRAYQSLAPSGRTKKLVAKVPTLARGGLLLATLRLRSKRPLHALLLEDYIPAGFELVSSGASVQPLPQGVYREDRKEGPSFLIAGLAAGGKLELNYVLKALYPGNYRARAPRALRVGTFETLGRGKSQRVRIKE